MAAATISKEPAWGKALIAGSVDWDIIGRKPKPGEPREALPNLETFHIIREFADLKIVKVVTGPSAAHSVFITDDGDAWVLGRNEKGQLGIGDTDPHPLPIKVPTLYADSGKKKGSLRVVDAAVGRNHTVLVTDTGAVYAAGDNKMGQLGQANLKEHTTFVPVSGLGKDKIIGVACGAEFTLVLNEKGQVWSFGSPEYGQLGNKTNGQYLQQSNRLVHIPQTNPVVVQGLQGKKIVKIACGANHSLALDEDGLVFSWGFGGYGRLGHSKQEDLWYAVSIDHFAGSAKITRATDIACGSTFSMALDGQRQFWLWGKWKNTGDGGGGSPWMYPRNLYDLNGWTFKAIAGGGVTLFAIPATEACTIAWGQNALNSELGYGEGEVRSSTKPDKVRPLEGLEMLNVSCGLGHTLLLCKPGQEKLQDLPKWPLLDVEDHCIECQSAENEDSMLLCDKCDSGTHLECTVPRLKQVPDTDWFCQSCNNAREKNRTQWQDASVKVSGGGKVGKNNGSAAATTSSGGSKGTKRKAPAPKRSSKKSKAKASDSEDDGDGSD
ncbi:hypothetical protein BGW42_003111 [Actinomortierella wolfii]|nr:hypothetical protein BGW42_003111 [Actinomortierella wolfii]